MELDYFQKRKIEEQGRPMPIMYNDYTVNNKAPKNIFRTMGVD